MEVSISAATSGHVSLAKFNLVFASFNVVMYLSISSRNVLILNNKHATVFEIDFKNYCHIYKTKEEKLNTKFIQSTLNLHKLVLDQV